MNQRFASAAERVSAPRPLPHLPSPHAAPWRVGPSGQMLPVAWRGDFLMFGIVHTYIEYPLASYPVIL